MNDHDLLITVNANLINLIQKFDSMEDGIKKDYLALKALVESNEKTIIRNDSRIDEANSNSRERDDRIIERVSNLERADSEMNTKSETNKVFIFRKLLGYFIPFVAFVGLLVLIKVGLISSELLK